MTKTQNTFFFSWQNFLIPHPPPLVVVNLKPLQWKSHQSGWKLVNLKTKFFG